VRKIVAREVAGDNRRLWGRPVRREVSSNGFATKIVAHS
ncbi:MAG: hypothetical protein RIR95_359, partial [Pseudomonadota bacterium]